MPNPLGQNNSGRVQVQVGADFVKYVVICGTLGICAELVLWLMRRRRAQHLRDHTDTADVVDTEMAIQWALAHQQPKADDSSRTHGRGYGALSIVAEPLQPEPLTPTAIAGDMTHCQETSKTYGDDA